MNKLVRLMTAVAATGALFLAPAVMAQTPPPTAMHHVHHKAKKAVAHKIARAKAVAHHKAVVHKRIVSHARTAQQEKMAQCAHQSKGMKGQAHRDFMSRCLKK